MAPNHECFPAEGLCNSEKMAAELETPAIRRAIPGATGLGIMAMVDVGWYVAGRDKNPDDLTSRIDGVVVAVVNKTDGDGETHRAFDVLHWPNARMRISTLTEAEVDIDYCALPDATSLRSHVRRLASDFYNSTRKRGAWDSTQLRAAPLIHLLCGVLQGTR